MRFFPPLLTNAGVRRILSVIPQTGRAPGAFHSAALRNAGPLEPGAQG